MNDIQFTPVAYDSTLEEQFEIFKKDIDVILDKILERITILEEKEEEK